MRAGIATDHGEFGPKEELITPLRRAGSPLSGQDQQHRKYC
jgi:hypothetical protein